MAFITTADIAVNLPVGFDSNEVDRLLLSAQADLQRIGLVFTDEPAASFVIHIDNPERSIFSITPTRDITAVQYGTLGSGALNTITEYATSQHANIAGYTTQITLTHYRLTRDQFLQVTGKRGIYINFSDADNYETKLLISGLTAWVRSQLNVKSGQALTQRGITQAGTGESRVSYGSSTSSGTVNGWGVLNDPDFISIKNWFKGL